MCGLHTDLLVGCVGIRAVEQRRKAGEREAGGPFAISLVKKKEKGPMGGPGLSCTLYTVYVATSGFFVAMYV